MTLADFDLLDRFKEPSDEPRKAVKDEDAAKKKGLVAVEDGLDEMPKEEFCPWGMSELLWSGERECFSETQANLSTHSYLFFITRFICSIYKSVNELFLLHYITFSLSLQTPWSPPGSR